MNGSILRSIAGVLLALGAAAPPSSPEWLELRATPAAARVHVDSAGAQALVSLDLINSTTRRVRIDDARLVYLRGDQVQKTQWLDHEFHRDERYPRRTRIDAGRREEWRAICLDPPQTADRVRIELELLGHRKLRRVQQRQTVEIPLEPAEAPVPLRLPFDRYWRVSQGHDCRTNHRIGGFGGDFAWDFVAVGPEGRSVREAFDVTHLNTDTFSFGRTLRAPVGGRVVTASDGVEDQQGLEAYPRRSLIDNLRDPNWIYGNYMVIEVADDIFVLIGHLKQGSLRVQPGERIVAGQPIAQCGNSGNTIEPHVHLQVMDRADPADSQVRGLPAAFADYMEYSAVQRGEITDLRAERIALGDPLEGHVIAPIEPD